MKKITKLVINRTKWGSRALLRGDGRMCCLGHLGLACGVPKKEMGGMEFPIDLGGFYSNKFPEKFRDIEKEDISSRAVGINDSKLTHKTKEKKLKELFKEAGINLSFRGDITKARFTKRGL